MGIINLFWAMLPFYKPFKTLENLHFSGVLREGFLVFSGGVK